MARNARVVCAADVWTELTNADCAGDVSVMLSGVQGVSLQAMATGTPTETTGPFELLSLGDGWSEATIQEKFTGVTGAVRLWSRPREAGKTAIVSISHGA